MYSTLGGTGQSDGYIHHRNLHSINQPSSSHSNLFNSDPRRTSLHSTPSKSLVLLIQNSVQSFLFLRHTLQPRHATVKLSTIYLVHAFILSDVATQPNKDTSVFRLTS